MAANKPIHISAQGTVQERIVPVSEGECVEFHGPDGFHVAFVEVNPFGNQPIDWQHPVTGPCHHIPGVKKYPYYVFLSGMVTDPPNGRPPGPIITPPPGLLGRDSRKRR